MVAFFIVAGLLVVFGPVTLAIISLVRATQANEEVNRLRAEVERLTLQIEADRTARAEAAGPEPEPARDTAVPDEEAGDDTPAAEDDVVSPAEAAASPDAELDAEPEPAPADQEPPIAARAAAPATEGFEQKLTVRWMVWLGGVAIALAGVFLVKYAAERGLLGPAARCGIAVVLGAALVCGGEWLRRNPDHGLARYAPGSYVPQALSAAGLFVAFAAIYAAYGLYDLIAPLATFVALAAIALAGFGLSILQGPFVALLGLIGGLVTPLLVDTGAPSAFGLFAYVALIVAACLAIVRYMRWWWLAFGAVAGGALWALLWLAVEHQPGDVLVLGTYLVALAAMSLLFWWNYEIPQRSDNWLEDIAGTTMPEAAGWLGAVAVAVLMPGLVQGSDQSFASLVFVAALCGLFGWFAWRTPSHDGLLGIGGVMVLFVIAIWELPGARESPGAFPLPGGWRFLGPVLDDELIPFVSTVWVFGALFAVAGYAGLWTAKRPAVWAGASSAVPVGLLVLSYFRIEDRVPDLNWSIVGLVLAGIAVGAAASTGRRNDERLAPALGVYAAAAVAALSFAMAMIFERALLTVAFSLQLPALAWIARSTGVGLLRWIAGVVAGVVLVRLALNWNVLGYPLGRDVGTNWVLYGYGIPAVAFYWAARQFRAVRDDHVVALLEGGTLLFATLLVSLEIRVLVEGSLEARHYGLFEQSLQTAAWLVIALSRIWSYAVRARLVSLWGARLLLVLAVAQTVLLQLLLSNPVVTGEPVGTLALINGLFLAYALPGLLLLAVSLWLEVIEFGWAKTPLRALSFLLFFVYVTLEVQRAYQGPVLSGYAQSDAEFYSYSAAWLGFALVLLALGIYFRFAMMRYASLAVLLVTVAKVFLLDMSDLTGLLRVASFLGLGLCLVGIGYVYQRFVFPQPGGPDPQEDAAGAGD